MMNYRVLLHAVVLSGLVFSAHANNDIVENAPTQKASSDQKKIVLVFGGHNVLWSKSALRLTRDLVKVFWNAKGDRTKLLKLFITRKFYSDWRKAAKKELMHGNNTLDTAEGIIKRFTKDYPDLEPYKDDILYAINIHKPNTLLIDFIKALQSSCRDNVFTGIATMQDQQSFDYSIARIKQDFEAELPYNFVVTADSNEDSLDRMIRFYNAIKAEAVKCVGDQDALIIFIDNDVERLKEAQKAGFKTIKFNNVPQCVDALIHAGVCMPDSVLLNGDFMHEKGWFGTHKNGSWLF